MASGMDVIDRGGQVMKGERHQSVSYLALIIALRRKSMSVLAAT